MCLRPRPGLLSRLEGYPPTQLHQPWKSERSLNLSKACVLNLGLIVAAKSVELWCVECVQGFGAELGVDSLRDLKRLVKRQVCVQISWPVAARCARSITVAKGLNCSKRCHVDIVRQPALR